MHRGGIHARARARHSLRGLGAARSQREILLAAGYGLADAERGIPNAPRTRFAIGSITKPFTAIVVLRLQEQGLLSVHDSICGHVTPCPQAWKPITLRRLLSHTSGIVNLVDGDDYRATTSQPTTREAVVAALVERPLAFPPGERFEYSNSGFCLLGVVIENVTGRSFADVIEELILRPAAMTDSGSGSQPPPAGASGMAVGYVPDEDGNLHPDSVVHPSWSFAAGGLYSTVLDLYNWSSALDAGELLSAESMQAMWTPILDDYGYGAQVTFETDRRGVATGLTVHTPRRSFAADRIVD